MGNEDVLVNVEQGVATITLNRPEKLNALTTEMAKKFSQVIQDVRADDGIKALVITGAGSGFCSGTDLESRTREMKEKRRERWEVISPTGYQLLPLVRLEKPTIAAVNGVAAGLGLSITLACDIRLASENARFSAVWVKRGLIPDGGATYFLPRILGISKALELMFSGDIMSATEAERIGLVSKVVPHNNLMTVAKETATKIAQGPSVAIELMKKAAYRALENSLELQLDFETYAQNICRQTQDYKEGVEAFMQKRPPQFKGG